MLAGPPGLAWLAQGCSRALARAGADRHHLHRAGGSASAGDGARPGLRDAVPQALTLGGVSAGQQSKAGKTPQVGLGPDGWVVVRPRWIPKVAARPKKKPRKSLTCGAFRGFWWRFRDATAAAPESLARSTG